jgi:NAD dependent epimerase/dehydratase
VSLSGKTVLVTGAGGFIGSHLAERLVNEGCDVTAMVRYSSTSHRGWLESSPLNKDMRFVYGDISDSYFVRDSVKGNEIVFHLAALIGIPYSYEAPHQYVRTNVEGTINVVQAAKELDIERVLQTSTSEVYGTALRAPIDEEHPKQPQSPYSASKISSDNLAESYYLSFNTPVVIIRPFNTFGPRQSMRAVIPTIIVQCLELGTVSLGNLTPTRDMNFVSNTADGFVKAALAPRDKVVGQHINLGTGVEFSIGEIAKMIADKTGVEFKIKEDPKRHRPDNSEVFRLIADRQKAQDLLGWRPEVDLSDGLDQTIEWFRENRHLYRADEYAV